MDRSLWDHLCQDFDPAKDNYVENIADHPELFDLNYCPPGGKGACRNADMLKGKGPYTNVKTQATRLLRVVCRPSRKQACLVLCSPAIGPGHRVCSIEISSDRLLVVSSRWV